MLNRLELEAGHGGHRRAFRHRGLTMGEPTADRRPVRGL